MDYLHYFKNVGMTFPRQHSTTKQLERWISIPKISTEQFGYIFIYINTYFIFEQIINDLMRRVHD